MTTAIPYLKGLARQLELNPAPGTWDDKKQIWVAWGKRWREGIKG